MIPVHPPLPPLVSALTPIRLLLHPFLTDVDAIRLLRVSRTTATSLLHSFTFYEHIFEPASVNEMRRMKALYQAYDMRQTRMCLGEALVLKDVRGESPFPSSLTSLLLGRVSRWSDGRLIPDCIFGPDPSKVDSIQCLWHSWPRDGDPLDETELGWWLDGSRRIVHCHVEPMMHFQCSLSPLLLPHGLRYLQIP